MADELARLEQLRTSSRDLVVYLEQVCEEFDMIQGENEKALRIMENWAAVFQTAKGVARIQLAPDGLSGSFRRDATSSSASTDG
ncbi:hypothetical protein H257_14083 [Aphanomyces astaci]|uniref:Uncharacterized protein n=1 Tax=Aphanomyces astaci TaxID=112090 RepID=W4FTX4_APHAT|nr:hypothetical protein H257_14083 [Aphanomyces astaci]ETV70406.1 hypothetical protein H257_14083 [Aphanomyces astaci]RQM24605.1 hypothetical protein B5M09_002771 [Aphanomyces astaci]|eukprot:XP_009840118.1 hypothetical protein H257_14083 [Aphanomyces astaci]